MFYHASPIPGITILTPHVSNHGTPLVYLSSKRENVLVYLSNAVEKFCKENGIAHSGPYKKWASYGFSGDVLHIDEYYPGAMEDTYSGVGGYIYRCRHSSCIRTQPDIPCAFICDEPVKVTGCEFIPDALREIIKAEKEGKLKINLYSSLTEKKKDWIRRSIAREYMQNSSHPEYLAFLQAKFPDIVSNL